jgi:hypothetical protein
MHKGTGEHSIVATLIDIALGEPEMVVEKAGRGSVLRRYELCNLGRCVASSPAESDIGACTKDETAKDDVAWVSPRRSSSIAAGFMVL